MNRLLELILKMEERPGMWIGNDNTDFLFQFLSGYCYAKLEGTDESSWVSELGKWLFVDFREYLAERYKDSRTIHWAGLISANEVNGNSTDAFFRLLHEYLEEHPI